MDFTTGTNAIIAVKNEVEETFSKVSYYFFTVSTLFKSLSIMLILLAGLSIVTVFGTQVTSCFRRRNKCHSLSCCSRVFITILGAYSLLLAIVILIFVILNFSVAGLCEFSYQGIIKEGSITDAQGSIPTLLKNFLNDECIKEVDLTADPIKKPKQLQEYIDFGNPTVEENYKTIGVFLDGFSNFSNFLKNQNSEENVNSISKTEEMWTLYKTGILYNFVNVGRKYLNIYNKSYSDKLIKKQHFRL